MITSGLSGRELTSDLLPTKRNLGQLNTSYPQWKEGRNGCVHVSYSVSFFYSYIVNSLNPCNSAIQFQTGSSHVNSHIPKAISHKYAHRPTWSTCPLIELGFSFQIILDYAKLTIIAKHYSKHYLMTGKYCYKCSLNYLWIKNANPCDFWSEISAMDWFSTEINNSLKCRE